MTLLAMSWSERLSMERPRQKQTMRKLTNQADLTPANPSIKTINTEGNDKELTQI